MSRTLSLLVFLFVSVGTNVPAAADPSNAILFEFPAVEANAPERRVLEHYLRRPDTLRCDLVEFEVGKLIGLINALDRQEFLVANSSVRIKVFDDELGEFQGIHFELGKERDNPGPYSWGGVLEGSPHITVNFIIDRFEIATMILDTGEIVYRTHVSPSSGNYFLCKTDGTRTRKRID